MYNECEKIMGFSLLPTRFYAAPPYDDAAHSRDPPRSVSLRKTPGLRSGIYMKLDYSALVMVVARTPEFMGMESRFVKKKGVGGNGAEIVGVTVLSIIAGLICPRGGRNSE